MGGGFCFDPLGSFPVYDTLENRRVGVVKFIIGILYFVMMLFTIYWVKMNEKKARTTFNPDATNTVIFPPFVKILWLSALSNAFIGFLMLFVPVEITGDDAHNNLSISVLLYPLAWGFQHFVVEGIACMLMQKGCGVGAARAAFKQSLCWALVTFAMQAGVYSSEEHTTAVILQVTWSCLLLGFFLLLWLAPQHHLFRRPAALSYAKFWFWFRVVSLLCFLAAESNIEGLEQVGGCGYVFLPLLGFPILQPLICYWTLLEDSLWWQGAFLSEFDDDDHSPLFGIDLTLNTALALAEVLDHISSSKSAKLINFAHIQTDWRLIGQGSFSKVFAGSYKHVPCALKLVFTTDLTAEDVNKATIEATLLSSIRSRNIINIYGICVNPPSVMIALELCELGSLYDVLRHDHLELSAHDRFFLALGCCRGLDALHSLNSNIVHRDIKSMNFLVDSHLNAKLCDLELGQNESVSKKINSESEAEKFLLNWMPPEYMQFKQYTRKSDIYALTLVLWEILSNDVPYSALSQQEIRLRVGGKEALRPSLSTSWDTGYCQLLTLGWAQVQESRPSSADMEAAMGNVWRGSFFHKHALLETSAVLSVALETALEKGVAARITSEGLEKQIAEPGHYEQHDHDVIEKGVRLVPMGQATNPLFMSQDGPSETGEGSGGGELRNLRLVLQAEREASGKYDGGWAHFAHLPSPVLIITRKHPHLILGASVTMGELLLGEGGNWENLVGRTLDSFMAPPTADSTDGAVIGGEEAAYPHKAPVRSALLKSFYKDMLLPDRAHLVATLQGEAGRREKIKCSVSSFPVHRFECDPTLTPAANQLAFSDYKASIVGSDELLRKTEVAPATRAGGVGGGAINGKLSPDGTDSSGGVDRNCHTGSGGPGAHYFGLLFSRLDK